MIEPTTKPKRGRGRPLGSFGPARRQKELVGQFIHALGGKVTPIEESNILRAVVLLSIAEQTRSDINKRGGTSDDLIALTRLEEVAQEAVDRLNLPESSSRHIKGIKHRFEDAR